MLPQTIDALYAAFAAVRRPTGIVGCPCCIEDKQIAVLLSRPLRELSAEELSSYASSVFLTVGDEEEFRYFVPRILEISATDPGWWPDPEVGRRRRVGDGFAGRRVLSRHAKQVGLEE